MKQFLDKLFAQNPILAGYIGIGPILLLSNRLIYALVFSAFYLAYFSLMALSDWLIDKYFMKELRFSGKLLFAAVFIALGDLIITTLMPLVRADMGILLPVILSGTHLYLAIFPEDRSEEAPAENRFGALFGNLFGFIGVFLVIALLRELLAYGSIDLNPTPWAGSPSGPTAFFLFSSGFGLLFILAYAKALFEKVMR
jgi:Na+-translocating ferredoxin:NAD+ oxidoreductase RnfA subunit